MQLLLLAAKNLMANILEIEGFTGIFSGSCQFLD